LGRKQCSNVGDNWSIKTTEHDAISLTHDTVGKHNIDSCTETFNNLDFKNGALELGEVHETLGHSRLSKLDEKKQQIRDTLAGVGRGGNERDGTTEIFVLIEKLGVETLFGECKFGVGKTLGELALGTTGLLVQGLTEGSIRRGLPVEETVDLWVRRA
jgi:hypothetical protein